MAFGIRNVPDRPAALREMVRVVRPGGRVAILEFSDPHEGFLAPVAKLFVRHVIPRIGALLSGGSKSEYLHLQKSIADFPLPSEFGNEMTSAGFASVSWTLVHPGGVYLYVADTREGGVQEEEKEDQGTNSPGDEVDSTSEGG